MSSSIDAVVHSLFATAKIFNVSPVYLAAAAVGDAVQRGAFCQRPDIRLPCETTYQGSDEPFQSLTYRVGKSYMGKRGFGNQPCLDAYFAARKIAEYVISYGDEQTPPERSLPGLWGCVPIDVLKIAVMNVRATVIARVPVRMEQEGVKPSLPFILKDMTAKALREVVYERSRFTGGIVLPVIAAYTATTQPVTAMNVTDAMARHMGGRPAALLRLQQSTCHS